MRGKAVREGIVEPRCPLGEWKKRNARRLEISVLSDMTQVCKS
jgi:hypothetical protein